MGPIAPVREFIRREWLLSLAVAAFLMTSLAARTLPRPDIHELEILVLLAALFTAVRGLEACGSLAAVAGSVGNGRTAGWGLVAAAYFLSMIVTNDAALVVICPLTLASGFRHPDRVIILEALAANAGSAMTPMGNPQNLYLYWHYAVPPLRFMAEIAPLGLVFLPVLLAAGWWAAAGRTGDRTGRPPTRVDQPRAWAWLVLLTLAVLVVLHLLPLWTIVAVFAFGLIAHRASLRIDYALLATFIFLFGSSANLETLAGSHLGPDTPVFLYSALTSQVMSNVPAATLFARFTSDWRDLLWGVSVGGFGSLPASVANLIAYRAFVATVDGGRARRFTATFIAAGAAAFGLGCAVFALIRVVRPH